MEVNKTDNESNNVKSSNKKEKKPIINIINNSNKDIRFIQTNFYLNDYNYYNKNNLKMNKLREEKIKEHKRTLDNDKRMNIMPKMLYFNKFFHTKPKIFSKKNNLKTIKNPYTKDKNPNSINISKTKEDLEYKKIELAIKSKSIEQNSKRHIKKTIKAFDDLLKYVDGFKIKNRKKNLQMLLNDNNDKNKDISDEEEDINIENFNFDEYRKKYKDEKMKQKSETYKTENKLNNKDLINEKEIQLNNILLDDNINNNENIYITAQGYKNEENKNLNLQRNNSFTQIKTDNPKKNENKKYLTINNMILISDDSLVTQIKKLRKNFKKDLYFNTNNFGKFKYTNPGLRYPQSFDKYKKFPDYKGTDKEEKRMFNYKTKVTNPRYNYTNIGSFNDKFNKDLSEISNSYGKEQSKGRFIRNPLISMFSKYIPNYEQYKDLKFIENRYTAGNKYMFRLKSLINNKKNNFDRLATNIYNKEHKAGYFE